MSEKTVTHEIRAVNTLVKLSKNPRTIKNRQFKILCESIERNPEYFEARPVILSDRTGEFVIIAGNQRFEAAKSLGLSEIPTVLISGLTEEEEKEIAIRDNVSNGEWDFEMLANEWEETQLNDFGMDVQFNSEDSEAAKYNNQNCEYPIIPRFDEKYNAIVIVCKSETEFARMKTMLNIPRKAQSYKNSFLGGTQVIDSEEVKSL